MNESSRDRIRRMALMALCAMGFHILALLAVRLEPTLPTPKPKDDSIAIILDAPPPEEPPVKQPERFEEPPPEPEQIEKPADDPPERIENPPTPIPDKPIAKPIEKKKDKPRPKPKPKPKPTVKPSVPVMPSVPAAPKMPKPEELPVVAPTIKTSQENRKPAYPELARKRGQQGRVLLRATIDETGALTDLVVQESSGHSMLDDAALKAVRRWKFAPATRGGASRKGTLLIPVTFRLNT